MPETGDVNELCFKTAVELRDLIAGRAVSAREVVDAHLQAIAARNPKVNAVVTLCAETAREDAGAVDAKVRAGEPLGPLAGVPVGIKDVTDTAGIRTTYGSRLFADHVPDADAAVVARLKAAGAIVIGKTNTPEFAAGANTVNALFGATRNPWDPALSAGGSTGGGAAGLASGLFAVAEGTDLGGSLRIPAAFCGVVGLRPTPGLVPYLPHPCPFDLLDVTGPMARTAGDVALALGVLAGPHPAYPGAARGFDAAPPVGEGTPLRIAYAADVAGVGVDREIAEICRAAALRLAELGHAVEEIELDLSPGRPAFSTLRAQWMVNRHQALLGHLSEINANLAGNIEKGLSQTPQQLAEAEAERHEVWRRMAAVLEPFDALLTPATAVNPFPVEQNYPETINGQPMQSYIDWAAPTFVISLLGLPAVSVPAGLTAAGLPVGLQLVGRRFGEAGLLGLAGRIQSRNPIGRPSL